MKMIIAVFCMIIAALCTGFHAWLVKPALDQVLVNANEFYLYFIPLVSKFRFLSIGVGLLYLLVSSIIIFGIDTFNYQKRVPLEKMCYDFHSDTDEKLSCCLKAGYIWQEGFSYFEDIPPGCKKYMNWND